MTVPQQTWPQDFADKYRHAGYWTGDTFSAMLRRCVQQRPHQVAVVDGERRWTTAQLLEKSEIAAAGFVALGLQPGDRVIVHLPNVAEFLTVIFGLFRARLIPVYMLPAHRRTEAIHFARTSGASAYVCRDQHDGFDYRTLADELQEQVPDVRHAVVIGDAQGRVSFNEFRPAPATLPSEDADPSNVAFLQISGGSTGLSKLIPRTHDDYLYSVRASADICEMDSNSVYMVALPMAHNFPMSSPGFLGALYAGSRIVLSPSPSPEAAFPLIEKEGVTMVGLVPPLALLWMHAAQSRSEDLSSLQVLQVGGAKFMPEAARRVGPSLDCQLQQVFGMAEGLVNYTRLGDPDNLVLDTQGRPISPDDEILILDDLGQPVAEGEVGHLLTRGPYTIRCYFNDDAANARSFTEDGYYRTGDMVKRTPEGYLVVQGRVNDHINRAGEKISAEEIEDHLLAHPSVFDVAVVSIPDEFLGERSCAFVVAVGQKPRSMELKAWMRTRQVADYKVPDQIVFVDSLQTTAVGKISRKELRAALRQQYLDKEN